MPSDADRARWRVRAREWLHADLAAHATNLRENAEAYGPPLIRVLKRWLVEPDLAGLRESPALAGMPGAERQECRRLWSEVERLIQEAKDSQ